MEHVDIVPRIANPIAITAKLPQGNEALNTKSEHTGIPSIQGKVNILRPNMNNANSFVNCNRPTSSLTNSLTKSNDSNINGGILGSEINAAENNGDTQVCEQQANDSNTNCLIRNAAIVALCILLVIMIIYISYKFYYYYINGNVKSAIDPSNNNPKLTNSIDGDSPESIAENNEKNKEKLESIKKEASKYINIDTQSSSDKRGSMTCPMSNKRQPTRMQPIKEKPVKVTQETKQSLPTKPINNPEIYDDIELEKKEIHMTQMQNNRPTGDKSKAEMSQSDINNIINKVNKESLNRYSEKPSTGLVNNDTNINTNLYNIKETSESSTIEEINFNIDGGNDGSVDGSDDDIEDYILHQDDTNSEASEASEASDDTEYESNKQQQELEQMTVEDNVYNYTRISNEDNQSDDGVVEPIPTNDTKQAVSKPAVKLKRVTKAKKPSKRLLTSLRK